MTRLAISVEGQTEEEFVNEVLAEYLIPKEVYPIPILLYGNVHFEKLVSEMVELSWNFDAVTSLVDYYGFRDKGKRSVRVLQKHLVQEIKGRSLGAKRCFPYVQKHEFEGLLFSNTEAFGVIEQVTAHDIAALSDIRRQFPTPEDINDHPERAQSKRIVNVVQGYRKRRDGLSVAQETGLATIRSACPRFNSWLTWLGRLTSKV